MASTRNVLSSLRIWPSLVLTPQSIPSSELVHYKTFDGKIITAVLRMPFNLKRDGSNPAIIFPHGGPTGQTSDTWSRWSNALVTRGYIVLMPNPRGSTGYGMDFQRANYKDLGGGDLKDEMYGLDWLLNTGFVDPTESRCFRWLLRRIHDPDARRQRDPTSSPPPLTCSVHWIGTQ